MSTTNEDDEDSDNFNQHRNQDFATEVLEQFEAEHQQQQYGQQPPLSQQIPKPPPRPSKEQPPQPHLLEQYPQYTNPTIQGTPPPIPPSSRTASTITPSPCPTTIAISDGGGRISSSASRALESNHIDISGENIDIPGSGQATGATKGTLRSEVASRLSHAINSGRVHLNPMFDRFVDRSSQVKTVVTKKVAKKIRKIKKRTGIGGPSDGDDVDDGDGDDHETKSLSIDSFYIQPAREDQAMAEKLIQATNYFIVAALVASFIIGILIIWLLAGLASTPDNSNRRGSSGMSSSHGYRSRGYHNIPLQPQCVPLRVPMCHRHRVGYSYTALPNSIRQFNQDTIHKSLTPFDKLIGVKCYSLLPLFLCSIFAPKCVPQSGTTTTDPLLTGYNSNLIFGNGPNFPPISPRTTISTSNTPSRPIPPCRSLCLEARRKCDFFLNVFTLSWPESPFLDCDSLPDSPDPEVCVGHRERQVLLRKLQACSKDGFRCDSTRCVPSKWVCDGFIDCQDGSDEKNCSYCSYDEFHCGSGVCIRREDICDGIKDCPDGRDERQCLRLSKKMGTSGDGKLEAWSAVTNTWMSVCGDEWDPSYKSNRACIKLGYKRANQTWLKEDPITAKNNNNHNHKVGNGGGGGGSSSSHTDRISVTTSKSFFNKASHKSQSNPICSVSVQLSCSNFQCGRTAMSYEPTSRIVGGTESLPGQWPWLVGLHGGEDEVFFCGGVLISEHWILSAAHCVGNRTETDGWTVHLGLTRRTASPVFVRRRGVSVIIKHPDFNRNGSYDNDIALLLLSEPVNFDEFLRPVCMPPRDVYLPEKTMCTVVGWGRSSYDDSTDYMDVINEVDVPIVNHSICANWYSPHSLNINENVICAGFPEGEKDSCQGDSGGPLMCRSGGENGPWFVAGIVSMGIQCAQPNLPGLYTKVSGYRDWIKNVTDEYYRALEW